MTRRDLKALLLENFFRNILKSREIYGEENFGVMDIM
jgi:hypothetical protein